MRFSFSDFLGKKVKLDERIFGIVPELFEIVSSIYYIIQNV